MKKVALLCAALAAAACTSAPAPEATPPPLVRGHKVMATPACAIELRGQVAPRSRIRLGFKQPGIIAAILVREGDRVAAGQTVARLDDVDARSAVRMARAAHDKAQRDADRAARLATEGALATSLRDDARSQLEAATAQLQQAEDALARTRLAAPATGTVFMRTAEPGEMLGSGSPVLVVDTTNALEVEAGASLGEARRLRPGLEASLVPEEGDPVPGRVTSVAITPNAADGLYAVEVAPRTTPRAWRPGALFRVRIEPGDDAAAIRIPLEALVHRQDRDYAFVLKLGNSGSAVVAMRPITSGAAEGREISVVSGLEAGEEIVAEGAYFLQDGQAVRIRR